MVFWIDNAIDKTNTMQQHVLSMRAGPTHAHVVRPARKPTLSSQSSHKTKVQYGNASTSHLLLWYYVIFLRSLDSTCHQSVSSFSFSDNVASESGSVATSTSSSPSLPVHSSSTSFVIVASTATAMDSSPS
jgi:hypothetical protein